MKIAVSAPPGGLTAAITRRLEDEGHHVQTLPDARPSSPANGSDVAAVKAIRRQLGRARVLLYVSRSGESGEPLPLRLRRCLAPLANLLSAAASPSGEVERVLLLSDARLYGEGSYFCPVNGNVTPGWRRLKDLRAQRWDHACPTCGETLVPAPTAESHPASPLSVPGTLAFAQERLALRWALERRTSVIALRHFDIYGNGGGGLAASVLARALAGEPVELNEDGAQTRDFVHVDDVARAVALALHLRAPDLLVLNVATGIQTSALDFVAHVERALGKPVRARVNGTYSRGEPRHLYAETAELAKLGYAPPAPLQEGLQRLVEGTAWKPSKRFQGRKR